MFLDSELWQDFAYSTASSNLKEYGLGSWELKVQRFIKMDQYGGKWLIYGLKHCKGN